MTLSRRSFLKGGISAAALALLPITLPEVEAVPAAVPMTEADLADDWQGELVDVTAAPFSLYSPLNTADTLFVWDADNNLIATSNDWSLNVHQPLGWTRDGSHYPAGSPEWSLNFRVEMHGLQATTLTDGRDLFVALNHPREQFVYRGRFWRYDNHTWMYDGRKMTAEISGQMSHVEVIAR